MMSDTEHRCAKCDSPAQAMCKACKDGADIHGQPSAVHYCGKECQTAHWSVHKSYCKRANYRKQLYRAGELAQRIFLDVRRPSFDISIGKVVETKKGYLSISEGEYRDGKVLIGLPEGVFATREDEEAMLAYSEHSQALTNMHKFVAAALAGSYKWMCETSITIAPGKARIACPDPAPGRGTQTTFKIELKDDNTYALDLTGATFGLRKVVMPWEEYRKALGLKEIADTAPGTSERSDMKLAALYRAALPRGVPVQVESNHYRNIIMLIQQNMWRCAHTATKAWMAKYDQNVTKMLMLSKPEYKQEFEALTSFVKHHVNLFVAWINARGFAEVINAFSNVFEGYLKERMKEVNEKASKDDQESSLKWKDMVEKDRFPELDEAFRDVEPKKGGVMHVFSEGGVMKMSEEMPDPSKIDW